jgi:hypothetical protein
MASIITATTTSGLTQSADNSGVLQLASGTGNLVTVPAVTGTAMVSGNMPAFSAYQSSAQSTTSSVNTKIQFQTEEFDTNNYFDNATNYRFTPLIAGYYQVSGSVSYASAASNMQATIYKNGTAYKAGYNATGTSGTDHVSALVYLNGSTDYIELYSIQTTGTLNTYAFAQYTYFQAVMVRAA